MQSVVPALIHVHLAVSAASVDKYGMDAKALPCDCGLAAVLQSHPLRRWKGWNVETLVAESREQ